MARPIGNKKPGPSRRDTESKTWRATEHGYALIGADLCGELVIRSDGIGLRRVSCRRLGTEPNESPMLLAVHSAASSRHPTFAIASASTSPECRVRGRLVDIQLEPTEQCPARMHIYWKAAPPDQLDMEVLASSVHVLDSFSVRTISRFPSGVVLIRASGAIGGWLDLHEARALGSKWLVFSRDRIAGITSLDGRSPDEDLGTLTGFYRQPVVLYRPAGRRWSYVEMSRPDDCAHIVAGLERRGTTVSFGLFGLDIEKGVILRGRVRGIFIPRANDLQTSLRLFARFAAESPRLSV